jgi:probable addiction module antidote protein
VTVTFTRFDAADYLKDAEDMAAYLDAVAEENDPALTIAALNTVVRARNVSKLARDAGMTREGVYKALSPDGNPSFATVAKIAKALGLRVELHPIVAAE